MVQGDVKEVLLAWAQIDLSPLILGGGFILENVLLTSEPPGVSYQLFIN